VLVVALTATAAIIGLTDSPAWTRGDTASALAQNPGRPPPTRSAPRTTTVEMPGSETVTMATL